MREITGFLSQTLAETRALAHIGRDELTYGVARDWADDLPVVDSLGEGHISDDSVGFERTFFRF